MGTRRRDQENYLEINHRDSPGFTPEEAFAAGLFGLPVGKGQVAKVPTLRCNHCEAQMIVNPMRTRDREICPKCDKYLCDSCKGHFRATGICYPWKQREDDWWKAVNRSIITV